jgi:N-acetylneuraminic acid mutarotase
MPGRPSLGRAALLLAVVAAFGFLSIVIVTDPRRIGVFPRQPGRTAAPGEAGWVRAADAPVELTEVAAAAHRGRIWVAGGLDDGGRAVDRLLVYDPAGDAWADGPPLPEPVHHAALVSDGDALFLTGGYAADGFDRPTAAVWRLDEDAGVWSPVEPLPEPRGAGAAAWNGRGGIIFGGGVGPGGPSADVFVLERGDWRLLGSLSRAREHLAASSSGAGSVSFLGGRDAAGNLGTVDLVSQEGVVGRAEDLPTARGGIAAFSAGVLGDCVVGGEGPDGTFGTVECVGAITSTLPGLTVPRHGLGAAFMDGRAYVMLGGPRPGLTVSAVVEMLDLR